MITIIQCIKLLVLMLLMLSCAKPTQKYKPEQTIKQAVKAPKSWVGKTNTNTSSIATWLVNFDDPIMLELIKYGKAYNIDLKIAAANMDKAWALAKQSGLALKPTADMSLSGVETSNAGSSAANTKFATALQASWELDVWGRIRSGIYATEAQAQSAQADYIFAQYSLSANIAKTYFKVIEAKLQANIMRENIITFEKILHISQTKHKDGMVSAQDVALSRANLAAAEEQLIVIDGFKRDAIRALEVLLGRYPKTELNTANVLPKLPQPPPAGIPSAILQRRPDLVAAERQIAAAFNVINQAEVARLPKFSLTSAINSSSDALANVLNSSNIAWQLASNLVAPLFDAGKSKLDIKIATIEQKQAIANYAQKALVAFAEVENNFDQGQVLASRQHVLTVAYNQSNKAYHIAQLRYQEGESDLLDTLQINQQVIAIKSELLSIERLQLEQLINLYLSLGGSW